MSDLALQDVLERVNRIAIIGTLLETFDSLEDRIDVIARLKAGEVISEMTADMLLEFYGVA